MNTSHFQDLILFTHGTEVSFRLFSSSLLLASTCSSTLVHLVGVTAGLFLRIQLLRPIDAVGLCTLIPSVVA